MKKNIRKNIRKNIAYIQDLDMLTHEQIKKYMGNIKFLSSEDPIKVYKFIVCCNKCNKITNFCLSINSGTLYEVNKLIKNNRKLDNCIFIATWSNANLVRDKIAKNIYFSLSSVNVMIQDYLDIAPYNIMTIVTDTKNPYFDQIYETGPKPAYRISELTVQKMNEFVNNGSAINLLIAFDNFPTDEFEKLSKILLDPACKYKNFATFVELDDVYIPTVNKLKLKLASITSIAANVGINGIVSSYPDINSLTLYSNCVIQLVNNYNSWSNFIKSSIVFNRFTTNNDNDKARRIKRRELLSTTTTTDDDR